VKLGSVLAPAVLLAMAGTAYGDDNFYCGETIIENGMQRAMVLEYCGEPTAREGDQWIYDRGDEQFLVVLHFDGDQVSEIEQVPRQ